MVLTGKPEAFIVVAMWASGFFCTFLRLLTDARWER